MEFKIGDRVIVCSKTFTKQNGLIGTIADLRRGPNLPVFVMYDEGQENHPYIVQYKDVEMNGNTYDYCDLLHTDEYPPNMEDTRSYLEAIS